jgi:hypothetical protein
MRTGLPPPVTPRDVLLYVIAYALWFVATAACAVAVIQLRSTVNALWIISGGDRYSLGFVNQVILLLGGLIALVYVMLLESYYRESVAHKQQGPDAGADASREAPAFQQRRLPRWLTRGGLGLLLRRFAVTTSVPLGMIVLSLAALELALRTIH